MCIKFLGRKQKIYVFPEMEKEEKLNLEKILSFNLS